MRSFRWGALCPALCGVVSLVLVAVLATGPVVAAEYPQTAEFSGRLLDGTGLPLSGSHAMTLRYVDREGNELFSETMDDVAVTAGSFDVVLGNGRAAGESSYASLGSVFADHPELWVEIAVGQTAYEPRVGVLPAGHSLKSRLVAAGLRDENDEEAHWKGYEAPSGATSIQSAVLAPVGAVRQVPDREDNVRRRPYTLPVVGPMISRAVRDLPLAAPQPMVSDSREVNPPRHEALFDKDGNRFGTVSPKVDDRLADSAASGTSTPALNFQFEGINNVNGVLPPDTEGTVGPNHYVQAVNLSFAVYDKSGTLLTGPSNTNTLWAGFGGPCQTDNSGDAILAYDEAADRFVLTQFAVAGSHQSVCFAISQTPDPTGSYYLYEVVTPRFPDYYKLGVWPDANNNAYFFGTNSGFQGQYDVFAVDRANMLAGAAARPMQFFQNFVNLMMPADPDGHAAGAPPANSPGDLLHLP